RHNPVTMPVRTIFRIPPDTTVAIKVQMFRVSDAVMFDIPHPITREHSDGLDVCGQPELRHSITRKRQEAQGKEKGRRQKRSKEKGRLTKHLRFATCNLQFNLPALTPALSPGRGGAFPCILFLGIPRNNPSARFFKWLDDVLPLPGERAGVRESKRDWGRAAA